MLRTPALSGLVDGGGRVERDRRERSSLQLEVVAGQPLGMTKPRDERGEREREAGGDLGREVLLIEAGDTGDVQTGDEPRGDAARDHADVWAAERDRSVQGQG